MHLGKPVSCFLICHFGDPDMYPSICYTNIEPKNQRFKGGVMRRHLLEKKKYIYIPNHSSISRSLYVGFSLEERPQKNMAEADNRVLCFLDRCLVPSGL
jgi:hypothetical protein